MNPKNFGEELPDFFSNLHLKKRCDKEDFEAFQSFLCNEQKKFSLQKEINNDAAVDFLFTPLYEKDEAFYRNKTNANALFTCVSKSIERIYRKPLPSYDSEINFSFFEDLVPAFFKELSYYRVYAFNMPPYALGMASCSDSLEILHASSHLLMHIFPQKHDLGNRIAPACSAFLIRQFIETRLSRAIGIIEIKDSKGKSVRYGRDRVVNFIKDQVKAGNIKTSFHFPHADKIYKWSNAFIHQGFLPQPWEVEWALHLLIGMNKQDALPFKQTGCESIHGAFWIKKTYYEKSLKDDFIKYIVNNNSDIYTLIECKPEAVVSECHDPL